MGEMLDKAKGYANEAAGKTKRAVGDALDRPDIRSEGDAQEATFRRPRAPSRVW